MAAMLSPAGQRHGAPGRVLQIGHAEERSRSAGAAGGLEGLGPDPVLVERQPTELKMKQARQSLDAGIGHLFGEDQVSRARDGREHDRRPMLRAARDQDPVRIGVQSASRHPAGTGSPVAGHPSRRLIEIHQPVEIRAAGKSLQRSPERRLAGIPDQTSLAQVQQGRIIALVVGALLQPGLPPPDERPAPYLSAQQSPLLGQCVGPAHGADRHAQPRGQLTLGGEPGSRRKNAGVYVPVEGVNQGLVLGLGGWIEGRGPHCHSVNLPFDRHCVNIDIGSIIPSSARQELP